MNNPVLILYLEDDPRDAELVRDQLQQARIPCELRVASNRAEYEAALAQTRFDLILSDYKLPNYDGMAALALARTKQPEVPFILISGTLGEERAVDCVVSGATDYVLKQRLQRLVPAVLRALTEAEEHRKRREAEETLRQQTGELHARNNELTRFNRVAVGRELRMIELKREVNELCRRLDEPPRHVMDLPPGVESDRSSVISHRSSVISEQ